MSSLRQSVTKFYDDLQYLASTKGSSSALFGGRSCTCVFHCTFQSLFFHVIFFFFFFSFFRFMVCSVEILTEAFRASLSLSLFTPEFFFCCFAESYDLIKRLFFGFFKITLLLLLLWASALCIRFTIIPPRLTDQRSFITVLIVTREPEQTTLLFWSAACGVTPQGLHTADRR